MWEILLRLLRAMRARLKSKGCHLISGHKALHLVCFTFTSGALQRALPGEYLNDPILSWGGGNVGSF